MDKRLLELALEALESRKAALDNEIVRIRQEMSGRRTYSQRADYSVAGKREIKRRRPKTAAEKRVLSEKMKAYWASRKTQPMRTQAR